MLGQALETSDRISRAWLAGALAMLAAISAVAVLRVGAFPRSAEAPSSGPEIVAGQPRAPHAEALSQLPLALLTAVSGAIGRGEPSFYATRSRLGTRLRAPGVGVLVEDGRAVLAGPAGASVSVAAVRRGAHEEMLSAGRVDTVANRARLQLGDVEEQYEAGPAGIEQRLILTRRPRGSSGPLTLTIPLGRSVEASQHGGTVELSGPFGEALDVYRGLMVADARHRRIPARLHAARHVLTVTIVDRSARYPITVDPLIQQGPKLTAADETGGGTFGVSVALSGDGDTAIVGGYLDDDSRGAAWIFTREGATWTQQGAKLIPTEAPAQALFGAAVALSEDGDTALIGAYGASSAWVFTRTGDTWSQQGSALTSEGGELGTAVSLSADGNTALVGGLNADDQHGTAQVFTRSGGKWTAQGGALEPVEEEGSGCFGTSASLSTDGNLALIGGQCDGGGVGAVWTYGRSDGHWSQLGRRLRGEGEIGDGSFGHSVSLSSDGSIAAVGADGDNDAVGAVWVYRRLGGEWVQDGPKLEGDEALESEYFGSAVAVAGNERSLLVGATNAVNAGAALRYSEVGGEWVQTEPRIVPGEVPLGYSFTQFGYAVALDADGTTALVGGPFADGEQVGAAWAFVEAPPTSSLGTTTVPLESSSDADTPPARGGSTAARHSVPVVPVVHPRFLVRLALHDTTVGELVGLESLHGTRAGEVVVLRCVSACRHRLVVRIPIRKGAEASRRVGFPALILSRATIVELQVSQTGSATRVIRYGFARGPRRVAVKRQGEACGSIGGPLGPCT